MRLLALLLLGTVAVAVSACSRPYPGRTSAGPSTPAVSPTTAATPTVRPAAGTTSVAGRTPAAGRSSSVAGRTTSVALTKAAGTAASAAYIATVQVTLRPVTRAGQPAAGYRVVTEEFDSFLCSDGPSPVAVSPDIRYCGYSATDTAACWKSAVPSTVLCLRNPVAGTLARIKYTGTFAPVAATANPAPQALILDDGTRCQLRNGGAWSMVPGHPDWVGWFWCIGGEDVYGPSRSNGIDRSAPRWSVHTVPRTGRQPIAQHSVISAYYVGTA